MLDTPTLSEPVAAEPAAVEPVTANQAGNRMVRVLLLLFLFIGLKAVGNLSLAWGTKHLPQHLAANPLFYVVALVNPFVFAGVVMMVLSLLTRMALLSVADLSFILPVTAIGYVVSALLGVMLLGEKVTPAAWLGTFLIFAGAAIVGSTPRVAVDSGSGR